MSELGRELEEQLVQGMESFRVPGAAVGVLHGSDEIRVAAGVTNVEHPLDVDDRTLFQVASNSKTFTATLVMALEAEGKVALDAPVSRYLPEFRLPDLARTDEVTIRRLLTHLVGWDGDALFVRPPRPASLTAIFEPMAKARQLVPPGTHWTYSNAAFSVAGRLVEQTMGKPFVQVLRERILDPLEMQHTFTRADEVVTHRVAAPHLTLPERDPIVLRGSGWQPHWELAPHDAPAAALISCVDDLLRWLRFQLGAEVANPPLASSALATMHQAQLEPWNPESGHAIGWGIWYANGAEILNHGGLTAGYCTYTMFSRPLDLGAVFLTNALSGGAAIRRLSRWLVGRMTGTPLPELEPSAKQPDLAPYTGAYSGAFGVRTLLQVEGELELSTAPHSTDDGSWQPPAEPPSRCSFYGPDRAVVTAPEASRGNTMEFGRSGSAIAWLRYRGRIHTRL